MGEEKQVKNLSVCALGSLEPKAPVVLLFIISINPRK